ncbi:hypothetical protein A6S26_05500 [Nostoc sp. ATCC 43529]|nr:hypothetical protein A6S26_05500 [Nostoc sp. ATCC 43529]
MLGFFSDLFSPVEEVTTANELQSLDPNLSKKDAERLALSINVGIARDKKKDKAASSNTNI